MSILIYCNLKKFSISKFTPFYLFKAYNNRIYLFRKNIFKKSNLMETYNFPFYFLNKMESYTFPLNCFASKKINFQLQVFYFINVFSRKTDEKISL